MKNSILSFCCLIFTLSLSAQKLSTDSIYSEFAACINKYLVATYVKDSSYFIYYGNINNFELKQFVGGDGIVHYADWAYSPPSDSGKKERVDFYRKASFIDFLNVMISPVATDKCKLPMLNGKVFFIHCPNELWEQFYYDEIIYQDYFYLTPIIDIIESNDKERKHIREMIVCKYSRASGFDIEKVVKIRESNNCQ